MPPQSFQELVNQTVIPQHQIPTCHHHSSGPCPTHRSSHLDQDRPQYKPERPPTLLFSSKNNPPPFATPWFRRVLQTTTHTTRTYPILGLSQTIIRLPIPINLRLPRSPITERRGLAIHHEPIHSAELPKSIFPEYLSNVALVSSFSLTTCYNPSTHIYYTFINP